jgi:hypothetical protein
LAQTNPSPLGMYMATPWIEIENRQHLDVPAGPGYEDYIWQAQFAFQVQILPHEEWAKLKWGFNASALFDECLERQKLFLESQYEVRHRLAIEAPDYRTLAFRFINRLGKGLLFSVLGKIHAKSEQEAKESALAYYSELNAIFPYDYKLVPALSRQEFFYTAGWEILDGSKGQGEIAQIKRLEIPLSMVRNSPFLQGVWQSGPRAHEQIWRSLASSSNPVLLNISLRCTVLYEKERERLMKFGEEISSVHEQHLNKQTLSGMQQWNKKYVERRLVPWAKYFYLQVHVASNSRLKGDLFRTIGTSLALNGSGESIPGYQVVSPESAEGWQTRLKNLDLIFSESYLPVSRLSEVADLEEVFAVVRLPYSPPDNGFPNVNFVTTSIEQIDQPA